MMKKSLAFLAIAGMFASPLALAQTPPPATSTTAPAPTNNSVPSGGSAPGGISGALGISTTALVVGVTGFVLLGVAISSADSSSSGGPTGTN